MSTLWEFLKAMTEVIQSLSIGKFPFYWRTKELDKSGKPYGTMMLDFDLTYDADFGFLKQKMSVELKEAIEAVYHFDHNIGYLQEGAEEFKTYGFEYLDVISDALSDHKAIVHPMKVVDIGCGGGLVLNEIKKRFPNARLHGVDPSPTAKRASKHFDFNLLGDFYPPRDRSTISSADLVLHYDVLEHVANPLKMLEEIYVDLRPGGLLVFSVPDCSKAIENGDISMCIHEHINYFSVYSLRYLVEGAGFQNVSVFRGKHGGTLFCVAEKPAMKSNKLSAEREHNPAEGFSRFVLKNQRLCKKFNKFLKQTADATIGFYVPLRAIPYVTKLKVRNDFKFYDDSCFFKNRVLDGFENKEILGIADLEVSPPDYTVVMTHIFGSLIKQNIAARSINTKVILIDEFYE
jgi:SAM-dependent methyltransferase